MKKKKVKPWTKAGKEMIKMFGVSEAAKTVVVCSPDHMSAMLCGRAATTLVTATRLAGHFGLRIEDFGQRTAKKKGGE